MDMHAGAGERIDLKGDGRIGRMPAGVGQSLLDGAVGDLAEGIVQLAELLDVDPGIHAHAGLARVGDELVERFPGEGRVVGRGQLDVRLIGMPEHVDDCVGFIQCARRLSADLLRLLGDGIGVGADGVLA